MTANKPQAAPLVPFAAVRAGYKVAFPVMVNGKEIISRGEIFQMRRVGKNRAEITLMHAKTGALFVNIVKGDDPVQIHSEALVQEPTDALTIALMAHVTELLKQQISEFYAIMPVED